MFVVVRGICMPIYFYKSLEEIYNDKDVTTLDYSLVFFISGAFNLGNFIWMKSLVNGYIDWIRS